MALVRIRKALNLWETGDRQMRMIMPMASLMRWFSVGEQNAGSSIYVGPEVPEVADDPDRAV